MMSHTKRRCKDAGAVKNRNVAGRSYETTSGELAAVKTHAATAEVRPLSF